MPLSTGTLLGPYQILAPIGAGGMGEVYRAHDSRLGRDVAIKVSNEQFSERFEREARAVAALNHPNICHLYDVGPNYLVMELVEGETLQGPLPLKTALDYARQIADALDAAHAKGIIHRDLKPANIKVTPQGVVKVLDFGLAKAAEGPAGDPQTSPTLTISQTHAGMILGTAAYMSPEQARGKTVDKRTDIWAFGVVLYEMLTGERAFKGETITDVLAAIVKEEPDWDRVPSPARRLVRRCLEKDPQRRLRDIGDAMQLLEEQPQAESLHHGRFPWAVTAAVVIFALAVAVTYFRRPAGETRVLKFFVPPPGKASFAPESLLAISPDGRRLAFVAMTDGHDSLWVRDLDSLAARLLSGTEGASYPFWSPDSHFLAFFAGGKLKKIDVGGGPALTLCDAVNSRGGSWGKDDVLVFAPDFNSGLSRVSAAGGPVIPVTELNRALGEFSHRFPWFLPDGHHFLYTSRPMEREKTAIFVADSNSKATHRVAAASSNAMYASPGLLLFLRDGTLLAQPFDAGKLETTGAPVPIAEQIDYVTNFSQGQFSASQNGILVYISSGSGSATQLTWFDRSGKALGTIGAPGVIGWPAISPDGNTVAVDRQDPQTGTSDLWLHDLARGTASRFTSNSKDNYRPVWSPDGQNIAFGSNRDGNSELYEKAISGGQEQRLDKAARVKFPQDWSRDGRYIIEGVRAPKTILDIWVLPLEGDRKAFPYLQTESNEFLPRLSPNGQWLAYISDETKRNEVYIQAFPTPGGKWQVSTNGGDRPVWSRDGMELYFIDADRKLMAVEVKTNGGKFDASVPKLLFDSHIGNTYFDVSKDGRFLMPVEIEQAASVPITVVVNWTAALKRD